MSEQRVVITGLGIYSSLGTDLQTVAQSLQEGKSGIVLDEERKQYGYRSGLTGRVERPNLKGILDRRARIMLPEQGEYAYMATVQALRHAKLDSEYIDSHEVGILYGNDSSASPVIEFNDTIRNAKDTMMAGSGAVFQTMNSTVTMNLATILKLKGVNFTVSGACASGSHAIGMGYLLIKHGYQDCIVCGGAQEINRYAMSTFDSLGAFSQHENDPAKASRPFDKNRDGLIPSGGAATVIIESLDNAQRRGAPILAEIIGYGFSSNGDHISNPTVEGPARAIAMSIKQAGIKVSDIDYINAHATSTPAGDAAEALAIRQLFGDRCPWVSSTKSMTGHECWMAGASEIVYCMLMMQHDFIAPNINFETPDDDTKHIKIATSRIHQSIGTFLSNSFGFGGTNSSLIVRKIMSK